MGENDSRPCLAIPVVINRVIGRRKRDLVLIRWPRARPSKPQAVDRVEVDLQIAEDSLELTFRSPPEAIGAAGGVKKSFRSGVPEYVVAELAFD